MGCSDVVCRAPVSLDDLSCRGRPALGIDRRRHHGVALAVDQAAYHTIAVDQSAYHALEPAEPGRHALGRLELLELGSVRAVIGAALLETLSR